MSFKNILRIFIRQPEVRLELLENMSDAAWDDAIADFEISCLFHKSAWLRFLMQTQPGSVIKMRIENQGETAGYFAGLLVKKGPFKILGSPLPGTTTEYMGPITRAVLNQYHFFEALDDFCKKYRIHGIEIRSPILDDQIMTEFGYEKSGGVTVIVSLDSDTENMFKLLDKKVRYYIRKGPRDGMVIENVKDPTFVEDYYFQLIEVFSQQGLVPTYDKNRVIRLFEILSPDHLFAIRACLDGQILATGIFIYNDRRIYYWGGASWLRFRHLCPNEPIQWKAMTMAAKMGIKDYDMGGSDTHFKLKFGGEKVCIPWYSKYSSRAARFGRNIYRDRFKVMQKFKGILRKGS